MIKTLISVLAILLALILLLNMQTAEFQAFTSETKRHIEISENPRQVIASQFENQQGEHIDWRQFGGKFVIADFIYTRCKTVCHGLGFQFAEFQRLAADLIASGKLHLLSISFDSKQDTPEALADYIARFSDDSHSWSAVRVLDDSNQAQLLQQFGVVAIDDGQGGYIHNAALHLISPDGRLIKIVKYEQANELISYLRQQLVSTEIDDNQFTGENLTVRY